MSHSLVSLVVILVRIVGIGFQALIVVVLANSISVSEMGLFSAIYIFWGLIRMLGPVGLDQVAMRDIAGFMARGEIHRAQAASNFSIVAVAAVGGLAGTVAWATLYLATDGGTHHYTSSAIAAAALATPAYALNRLLVAQLRGFGKTVQSQVSEAVTLHALSLVFLVLLAWSDALTLEAALIVHAAAAWSVMAIYAILRIRCGADPRARLPASECKAMCADGFQIWQALSLTGIAERGPTYLSLGLLGPAATAIVDIANRFGTVPNVFTEGVATTFAPVYARLRATGDLDQYQAALTLSSWLAFVPAMSALVGLLVLGPWMLSVFFPPSYQEAFWPLVLVCAAATINAAFGLASCAFLVTGRQALVRRYTAFSLLVLLTACAALGWLFGPTGVAAGLVLGAVVRDGGLAHILAKETGSPVMLDLNPLLNAVRQARAGAFWPFPAGASQESKH